MSEQRTEAWFLERCGKATASRIADVVAKTRNGWGASRANYAGQLIAERLTGKPMESYQSAEMKWGTLTEPQARGAYEFYLDVTVEEVGFISHPRISMAGASPDGFIDKGGLIEIKAPNTATHLDTLLGAPIDQRYQLQMQWQMACTQRAWCDFVSFDPRLPERMRMKIIRVRRDEEVIRMLEKEVVVFLYEIKEKIVVLEELYQETRAA